MESVTIFDYKISNKGCEGDIQTALKMCNSNLNKGYMACVNAHSIAAATNDPLFKKALQSADIILPDGSGILLASVLRRQKIKEKVAGIDFFNGFNKASQDLGKIRYFFLGSTPLVLNKIVNKLQSEYDHIFICGTYSPPFKKEFNQDDNRKMIQAINQSAPDVLWVGMTAPKQEKWIHQNIDKLNLRFIGAIGAVFDYYSGTKIRSSDFWVKLGLEWLPRFLKEPKRLWKRVSISIPLFLWCTVKEVQKNSPKS